MLRALSAMIAWTFMFYLLCYFGEIVTEAFAKLHFSIYERSWYLYPLDLRRYMVLMILATETPIYFNGFGPLQCSCEAFKKV